MLAEIWTQITVFNIIKQCSAQRRGAGRIWQREEHKQGLADTKPAPSLPSEKNLLSAELSTYRACSRSRQNQSLPAHPNIPNRSPPAAVEKLWSCCCCWSCMPAVSCLPCSLALGYRTLESDSLPAGSAQCPLRLLGASRTQLEVRTGEGRMPQHAHGESLKRGEMKNLCFVLLGSTAGGQ